MNPERDVLIVVAGTLAAAALIGLVAGIAIDRITRRQR